LGFAAGASYSWSFQANKGLKIPEALNLFAFLDPAGNMGKLAFTMGNIYREVAVEPENASALFYILQNPINDWKGYLEPGSAIQVFHHTLDMINQIAENLSSSASLRPDDGLLQREYNLTTDLLRHACKRGIYGFGSSEYSRNILSDDLERIVTEFQNVWLSRNRPGGLMDSLSYFEKSKKEYH
jgi:hypothetical protein